MKFIYVILVSAFFIGTFTNCNKLGSNNKPDLKNEADSLSYYMGTYTGLVLKELGYKDFNNALSDRALLEVFTKEFPAISKSEADSIVSTYFSRIRHKKNLIILEEGRAFLSKNKLRKGVKVADSGLQYELIKEGDGSKPVINDAIVLRYRGKTMDGSIFIDKVEHGPDTLIFIGSTPGLKEAIEMMSVGSKYIFYMPTELFFSTRAAFGGKVKPNMPVIFEIELLEILHSNSASKGK